MKSFCFEYCTRSWKEFAYRVMSISATLPLVLCVYNFVLKLLYLFFIFLSVLADQGICASGWFVRMEKSNCTPNTNNYVLEHFKNT